MTTKAVKAVLIAAAVAACIAIGCAPEAAKKDAEVVAKLVAALETFDYTAFCADGEPGFKGITPEQFHAVASALGPKLKAGKSVSYLGDLKQRGYRVTLWKIAYNDGSDDGLATLSMKDGKVGGFIIR
jgi:hypothetical protein